MNTLANPTPKKGTVTPWSYSSLTAFETCPRRFHLTRIAKVVVEPQTQATIHGNEVHKALELYVGGKEALPEKYKQYKPMADKLRMTPGQKFLEERLGLTKALTPTTFFAKDVWLRSVLDVNILREKSAIVLDYKTGKRKVDGDQLRLFAGVALSKWPHIKEVKTGYLWLQTGQMDTQTFTQDDRQPIMQEFAVRVSRMEKAQAADEWVPRPSGLCREWCPVGKRNCEYCGK